jgi:Na+/H+ antiporter NhaD/arsenite permease-like protein
MKIDRTGAAIIGAVLMVAFRAVPAAQALRFIDFPTIVLLFSMMLLVAYLRIAGFFDWVADLVVRQLAPRHLLPAIIFTSGLLSAFFVNDVICLVMVPFALTATRRMGLRPVPYLLAVATASNIGSVATITGNPQNILIGSLSGIRYTTFLARLGPIAVAGLFVNWLVIWLLDTRSSPIPKTTPETTPRAVSRAARHALTDTGPQTIRQATSNATKTAVASENWEANLPDNRPHSASADSAPPPRLSRQIVKPAIVAMLVLAGFLSGAPPALVAALGAATMLITRERDPREVYGQVDWGLLVFFVGLFLIVGGAENAGLMTRILGWGHRWNLESAGTFTVATALFSNVVSNVPAVMLLKSLAPHIVSHHGSANPQTAWLLLAMSSTLAGNLTVTGSIANIIVIERARPEAEISFTQYARIVPVTIATLALGWLWLAIIH